MLRELPWRQFVKWMEYDEVDPIGGRRGDWQAAAICAAVANVTLASRGGRKRFRISDFMIEFKRQANEVPKEDTKTPTTPWQEMRFMAQMLTAAANADEARKRKGKR
jgi:hypothetical protein